MMITVDNIRIFAEEGITNEEIMAIVEEEKMLWQKRGKVLGELRLSLEGEEIVVKTVERSPIKRIRRITGYLSGKENFNDAKLAELCDRVAHA